MHFLPDRPARGVQPLYRYLRGLLLWWLLPLAFSAAIAVAVSVHELYEDQAIRAHRWARNLANALDLELIRRLEGLRTVAALTAAEQRSHSMDAWAQSASSYHQHFGMPIMLVDAHRKMLRHSRHPSDASLPALPESQGRAAFEQALETGQAQMGDPVMGPMLGKPVVQIMLPLPEQGQMLVGAVPSDVLGAILASQDLPRGWRATLLDSVGREVAATGLEDEQDLPFPPSARRASSALSAAPFQVVLDVGPAVFYKDAIFLGGLMIFSVLVMLTLLAQSARRASLGLAASVRQLIDPADQSAPLADVPKIAEIEAARIGLAAARAAEQSSRAREQFIFQLSDSLRLLTDAGSIQEEGCRALAQFLDVERVFFAALDEEEGVGQVLREALRGSASSVLGEYSMAQLSWALEPMAGGQALAISDTHSCPWLSPEGRAMCEADAIQAYLGAPVLKDGRLVAVLCVTHGQPRSWSHDEQLLVQEAGHRLWASTERAQTIEALSARTLELASQTRQLRWLASELTLAEHRTREQISKALHDHLQQILFSASLTLQRAIAKSSGDPLLEQTKLGLKEAMEAARTLSLEVFPPALRSEGLPGALQWLASWMQKKYGLHMEVSADPQVNPHAVDIRILLFECVRELLFNVVKHARAHRVTIKASLEPGPMVQIILADDGVGFDPARAFKSGADAPGLGLFSIRERLALLGGEMKVDSSPGRGSRFTLRVPDQGVQQQAHVPAAQELLEGKDVAPPDIEPSAGVLRILLVDDHAMVRAGLRQLIISLPHLEVVGEAVNGMEAVVMARQLRPDVVVMDKSMPVLGGVAATRKILADNPGIVVLGMSMDDGDVLQQFEQAGAAGFFSKKDGAELLLQRLEIERLIRVGGGGGLMTLGRPPAGA